MRPAPLTLACVLAVAAAPLHAQHDHSASETKQRHRGDAATGHEHPPRSTEAVEDGHARQQQADGSAVHATPARDEAGHGSMDHGSMDHEPMDHEPMDHGSMDHGSMDHGSMDHGSMDHGSMDHESMDHESMDHGSMDHGSDQAGHMPPGRHAPRTAIPEVTDAARAAAFPELEGHTTHDDHVFHMVRFNRFEYVNADHGSGFAWEGSAWIGTDWNRLWLRSEGERLDGTTESADLEVLYGRPVAPWWDAVVGLRHGFAPGESLTSLAVGVMGLAPQMFEIQATAYLDQDGHLSATAEAEYELLLTNRLVLQPLLELELQGSDDPERGVGSGLSKAELGLRLRYELSRQFAPYVGVVRERVFGNTAELHRAAGEHVEDTLLVAGVRFWF